ncbi:hypothetical protein SGHV131 [Glossina pallidipes salivary gland hypertrophy virus]|uniref:Uncharacterized protein n=1 Tax=Glossina hytrovirus (isolate Glossina pallidipes/Ethiopia/Seibersdorf/-) TaxID=379529 RepID=B0YLT5_GHVS|nr:hypothetical protein SGHV131 [Glossina pallidipes salivary gland hypertrophy virus]ABQ08904.1 hypothetical protein SGHV131 [Glossina pallidipes salivary gland hypertrophy virus]
MNKKATINYSQKYSNFLHRCLYSVKCHFCNLLIVVSQYPKHLKLIHDHKDQFICIWCFEFKWKKGASNNNYTHRYFCLKDHLLPKNPNSEFDIEECQTAPDKTLFLQCIKCNEFYNTCRNIYIPNEKFKVKYFGTPIGTNWPLIESLLNPAHLDRWKILSSSLKFIDDVGFDNRWLFAFNNLQKVTWYQCIVRKHVWDDVYEFLNNNEQVCVLPNWSLSNGGHPNDFDKYYRQIIVIMPNLYRYSFNLNLLHIVNNCKTRIHSTIPLVDRHVLKYRLCITLDTLSQFLNAIIYITSPDSFHHKGAHFYIYKPIVPHLYLICMGLFKNSHGLIGKLLMGEGVIENINTKANATKNTIHLKYIIKNTNINHILPFEYILKKTQTETPIYILNTLNYKLFFDINESENYFNLKREEYNELQQSLQLFRNDPIRLNKINTILLHEINKATRLYKHKLTDKDFQIAHLRQQIEKLKEDYVVPEKFKEDYVVPTKKNKPDIETFNEFTDEESNDYVRQNIKNVINDFINEEDEIKQMLDEDAIIKKSIKEFNAFLHSEESNIQFNEDSNTQIDPLINNQVVDNEIVIQTNNNEIDDQTSNNDDQTFISETDNQTYDDDDDDDEIINVDQIDDDEITNVQQLDENSIIMQQPNIQCYNEPQLEENSIIVQQPSTNQYYTAEINKYYTEINQYYTEINKEPNNHNDLSNDNSYDDENNLQIDEDRENVNAVGQEQIDESRENVNAVGEEQTDEGRENVNAVGEEHDYNEKIYPRINCQPDDYKVYYNLPNIQENVYNELIIQYNSNRQSVIQSTTAVRPRQNEIDILQDITISIPYNKY